MALSDIIKTLENQAQAQIQEIRAEHDKTQREIAEDFAARIAGARERLLATAEREAHKAADMEVFARQSELKNEVLRRRRQLLDQVYDQALHELSKVSDAEYESLLTRLLNNLPADGIIVPARGREDITKRALAKMHGKTILADHSINAVGGFVWQSEKVNIDNTFEQLIRDLRSSSEIEVAKVLFE